MTSEPRAGDVRVGLEPDTGRPARRFHPAARVVLAALAMLVSALSPLPLLLIPGAQAYLNAATPEVAGAFIIGMSVLPFLAAIGLVWLLMKYVDRRPMRESGVVWTRRSLPIFLGSIAAVVALVVACGLAVEATGLLREGGSLGGGALWMVILVALAQAFLLQGIPEEFIWRGYMLQTLSVRPWVAVLISAAGFASLHIISQGGQQNALERVLYLAVPFGFGLLAGALVVQTGSVWAAAGVHGGFHTGLLICSLLGVGNGPAFWLASGGLLGIIGVVLLWLPERRTRQAQASVDDARTSLPRTD
ncbi:CPBP family intramembrane glutamic endopeptidase [Mobilicoccus caccae]|uniref:CAAX prenyl protease 2/Lysostaphin resistance protein A-like domain-containing protein n=1 Tax=Mobilicoccus caccae TaxID=1859295 RepID=A0ABQ6IK07_9MICO|nr:CPBP family glutamic-type intramembrane protease [Mobilicoccus caccae]GMA38244.1 hypothetical protein GCM10025883_02890 [Mobilicoccus caccae]